MELHDIFRDGPGESGRSRRKQTILRSKNRRSFEPKRTILWMKADDLTKAVLVIEVKKCHFWWKRFYFSKDSFLYNRKWRPSQYLQSGYTQDCSNFLTDRFCDDNLFFLESNLSILSKHGSPGHVFNHCVSALLMNIKLNWPWSDVSSLFFYEFLTRESTRWDEISMTNKNFNKMVQNSFGTIHSASEWQFLDPLSSQVLPYRTQGDQLLIQFLPSKSWSRDFKLSEKSLLIHLQMLRTGSKIFFRTGSNVFFHVIVQLDQW